LVSGGRIAHAASGSYVAAFGQDLADDPARRALVCAEEMVRRGLAERVRVDLAQVTAQARKDGTKRLLSPLFSRADRYPSPDDPRGVDVTADAAAVLGDAARTTLRAPTRFPSSPAAESTEDVPAWRLVGRTDLLASLVESARRAAAEHRPTVVSVEGE